jgi:PGF-CTERM protein
MTCRRVRVVGTLCVVVLLVVAGVAPAVAAADAESERDAWAPTADDGTTPIAPQTGGEAIIHQRGIVSRNPEPGNVTLTFEYEVASSITGLRVAVPVVGLDGIDVAGMDGFERTERGYFLWDGETERPTISMTMAVSDSISEGVRGVERDDWALVSEPQTRVQVRTDAQPLQTSSFTVADGEEGYARSHLAYLGPHERRNVTVADERATFVLGAEDADPTRAIEFLRTANEHFDFGIQRDAVTVFVLPLTAAETENIEAATIDSAFWLGASGIEFDETGAVFAHEYVHTRLETIGRGDATWVTEASAEYYGRLFALNDGVGTYDAFLDGLRASQYAPDRRNVILTDGETWRGTQAHYDKGAHVLAALDAEIRRRTDGEHTLRDVFTGRTEAFENYRAFRAAVIEVSGDESLGAWLDRYATTDALPPLPEDPRYYVAEPSLDPDGDGMTSGAELDADRHPFVEGAAAERLHERRTATVTPTETPTQTDAANGDETTAGPTGTEGQGPGFGVVAVLAALAALAVGVRRKE